MRLQEYKKIETAVQTMVEAVLDRNNFGQDDEDMDFYDNYLTLANTDDNDDEEVQEKMNEAEGLIDKIEEAIKSTIKSHFKIK